MYSQQPRQRRRSGTSPRSVGKSNYSLVRILRLVFTILFSYSSYPLRAAAVGGFAMSALSFLLGWLLPARGPSSRDTRVEGWTTLVVLVSAFSGFTIALLSMVGEYVVRTLNTVSADDSYHVVDRVQRVSRPLPGRSAPSGAARRTSTTCSPPTRRSRWRARPRPEPKVFLADEVVDARARLVPPHLLRARHRRRPARREEHQLPRVRRRAAIRVGRGRSATRGSSSSCATRSSGRCRTGASAATTAWRTGRWPRRSAQPGPGRATWDPERSVGVAVRLPRARSVRRATSARGSTRFPDWCASQFLEELVADPEVIGDLYAVAGRRPDASGPTELGLPVQRERTSRPASSTRTCASRLRDYYRDSDAGAGRAARPRAALARTRPRRGAPSHDRRSDILFNRARARGQGARLRRASRSRAATPRRRAVLERARAMLQEATGAEEVLLTTSCTTALELSAMLLDLGPDDTVIVPSFTFTTQRPGVRPAGRPDPVLRHRAARPWASTPSTSPSCSTTPCAPSSRPLRRHRVRRRPAYARCSRTGPTSPSSRTPRTGCSDAGAGEPLGSLGRLASLSFHETKNFVCGEGGALLLNDPRDVDRARVLYDKGTDRRGVLPRARSTSTRGATPGSSFGLSDALAAYLTRPARAGRDRSRPKRRARLRGLPRARSAEPAAELGLRLPVVPGRLRARPGTSSTCCMPDHDDPDPGDGRAARAGHPDDVPLRAAARLRRRTPVRRAARSSAR